MVGASTVVVDNPQLTARPGGVEAERQPLRGRGDRPGRHPPGGAPPPPCAPTPRPPPPRPGGVEAERQPLRVVADSRGRISLEAAVLRGPAKTLVATTAASSPGGREGPP